MSHEHDHCLDCQEPYSQLHLPVILSCCQNIICRACAFRKWVHRRRRCWYPECSNYNTNILTLRCAGSFTPPYTDVGHLEEGEDGIVLISIEDLKQKQRLDTTNVEDAEIEGSVAEEVEEVIIISDSEEEVEVEEVIIISDSESEDANEETEVGRQNDHQDEEDIIEPHSLSSSASSTTPDRLLPSQWQPPPVNKNHSAPKKPPRRTTQPTATFRPPSLHLPGKEEIPKYVLNFSPSKFKDKQSELS